MKKAQGFTLFELLVGIAILGIIVSIAMPSLTHFTIKMRVDGEISQLQRMILTARNSAINAEQTVTVCPLNSSNTCQNNWKGEITVFTDIDNDGIYEPGNNEERIKVKEAYSGNDTISYPRTRISYEPDGTLDGAFNGTLRVCPPEDDTLSRGIVVNNFGRAAASKDIDKDGRDEDRSGVDISCA